MPKLDVQVSSVFRGELRVEVDGLVRLGLGLVAGQPVEVPDRQRSLRRPVVWPTSIRWPSGSRM
jgi:hypothetical protein